MIFSLENYNKINSENAYFFPNNFFPFLPIDKKKYSELANYHEHNGYSYDDSFKELKMRVGKDYFRKVYPAQGSALSFSELSFPAYKFLIPEILADDWLSIVDWHKKHCRDHALHQPLTAYIVNKLLNGCLDEKEFEINGNSLLDLCIDKIFNWEKTEYIREYLINIGVNRESELLYKNDLSINFWKIMFFETAIVAAMFHDIGYPWQYINNLNKSLSTADFSRNNSLANAEHIYNCFNNRLIFYPFNGYKSLTNNTPCEWKNKLLELISISLTETHGFSGALGFLYLNDFIKEFPSFKHLPFHNFCVDWAALGIMMHDLKKIYHGKDDNTPPDNNQMRLEFDRDPISCIITLADVLQEFNRPNVNFKNYEHDYHSEFHYNHDCDMSELIYENGILKINYYYNNPDAYIINKEVFIPKQEKEYFDPEHGYLDFSSIGIKKVKINAI